jgi:hypothetical protein
VCLGDRVTHINGGAPIVSGQEVTRTVAACAALTGSSSTLIRLTVRRGFVPLAESMPVAAYNATASATDECGTPIAQACTGGSVGIGFASVVPYDEKLDAAYVSVHVTLLRISLRAKVLLLRHC